MVFQQTRNPDGTIMLSGSDQGVYQSNPYKYSVNIVADESSGQIASSSRLNINNEPVYIKESSHMPRGGGQTTIRFYDPSYGSHQIALETTPSRGDVMTLTGTVDNKSIGNITIDFNSAARDGHSANYQSIMQQIQSQLGGSRSGIPQININPFTKAIAGMAGQEVRQAATQYQPGRDISGCALLCTAAAEGAALVCGTAAPPAIVACAAASLALQGACLSHCATAGQ